VAIGKRAAPTVPEVNLSAFNSVILLPSPWRAEVAQTIEPFIQLLLPTEQIIKAHIVPVAVWLPTSMHVAFKLAELASIQVETQTVLAESKLVQTQFPVPDAHSFLTITSESVGKLIWGVFPPEEANGLTAVTDVTVP
tara:strand:+ start:1085 stop:1498 length:414 start_codon:yes stop_codon:yes gene_type:complete